MESVVGLDKVYHGRSRPRDTDFPRVSKESLKPLTDMPVSTDDPDKFAFAAACADKLLDLYRHLANLPSKTLMDCLSQRHQSPMDPRQEEPKKKRKHTHCKYPHQASDIEQSQGSSSTPRNHTERDDPREPSKMSTTSDKGTQTGRGRSGGDVELREKIKRRDKRLKGLLERNSKLAVEVAQLRQQIGPSRHVSGT